MWCHNISSHQERKIIFELSLIPTLIWSSDTYLAFYHKMSPHVLSLKYDEIPQGLFVPLDKIIFKTAELISILCDRSLAIIFSNYIYKVDVK